jgi:hypothetical protein
MSARVLSDMKLSDSSYSHTIAVPVEKVDIPGWLFSLPEAEYQRCCPPDHVAAGSTTTDDGRPMSINVEMIGQTLMVQNYVGEITDKDHCRMVSISDAFTPNGRTRVQVIWDLSVKKIDANSCEYTNRVVAHPTEEFLDFIKQHNVKFEDAAAQRQRDGGDHNRRETPLFAESIARKALAKSR